MFSSWRSKHSTHNGISDQENQNIIDTTEKLCDRLKTSTMISDQKSAIKTLREYSKPHQLQVGTIAMPILLELLQTDDVDLLNDVLETLIMICSSNDTSDIKKDANSPNQLSGQFTEIFIKTPKHVSQLIELIDSKMDIYTRYYSVQLLVVLLKNKPTSVKQSILTSEAGLSRMVDLLNESKEAIRNEGLLLLNLLSENNSEIQKIIVFENAFEKLFDLLETEKNQLNSHPDLDLENEEQKQVYEALLFLPNQCFSIMKHLLEHNVSNASYFRETGGIQRLCRLLKDLSSSLPNDRASFLIKNILSIINLLLVPDHPNTDKNQTIIGTLENLQYLLFLFYFPKLVGHSLKAIRFIIQFHSSNQKLFATLSFPPAFPRMESSIIPYKTLNDACSQFPIPSLLAICHLALDKSQNSSLSIRFDAFSVFKAYCIDNQEGQQVILGTMAPTSIISDSNSSIGSLILTCLLDKESMVRDPFKSFFASLLLASCLYRNEDCKQLVNVYLLDERFPQVDGMSLISAIMYMLMQHHNTFDDFILCGFYTLLLVWFDCSPQSVKLFLDDSIHLQFLIEQIKQSSSIHAFAKELHVLVILLYGSLIVFNPNNSEGITKSSLQDILYTRIGSDIIFSKLLQFKSSTSWQYSQQYSRQQSIDSNECMYLDPLLVSIIQRIMDELLLKKTNTSSSSVKVDSIRKLYQELKEEHDDLLICLAELDIENKELKEKIKELTSTTQKQSNRTIEYIPASYVSSETHDLNPKGTSVHKIPSFLINIQ